MAIELINDHEAWLKFRDWQQHNYEYYFPKRIPGYPFIIICDDNEYHIIRPTDFYPNLQ